MFVINICILDQKKKLLNLQDIPRALILITVGKPLNNRKSFHFMSYIQLRAHKSPFLTQSILK